MITHGDTVINFTKVKGSQLANIRTVIKKRPKTKFSLGLSMEAQEAMQQVLEESKIEESARRGKRGSKGNVLFSDTIQIRRASTTSKIGFFDVVKDATSPRTPRSQRLEGRDSVRNLNLAPRSDRRGSITMALDQIAIANRPSRERKVSRILEDGKKEEKPKEDTVGKLKRTTSSNFPSNKLPRSGSSGPGS